MEDAANLLVLPEYLGFDTPSTVADAVQFYQDQLPAEGWSLSGETSVTADTAVADFTKGDQILHVIVTTGDAATHVDVVLTTAG